MRIKRDELLRQLSAVAPGLSSKEVIEQSNSFVFRDGRVYTFNDEVACSVDCCLKLDGAVPADPLVGLLRKLGEDELDVECTPSSDGYAELVVKGNRRKAGIRMGTEITLPLEGIEQPGKWSKLPAGWTDAVTVAQQCVSRDESQFILTCVHLHPEWVEGCDNYQLVRYPMKTGLSSSTLVRGAALRGILSVDATEWSLTDTWLHFRGPSGLVLSSRRYADTYPNCGSFLQVDGADTPLPKGLDGVVERASVFSNNSDDPYPIKVEIRTGKLRLTGRGPNGWYNETRDLPEYKGESLSFVVTPKLLLEIIKRADRCTVAPGRIAVKTENWQYVSSTGLPEPQAAENG